LTADQFVERNEDSYLYTVLLSAFVECDGITALLNIGRRFVATIERVGALAPADRTDSLKEELVCAYAGLKVLLHFLQPIISARPIIESPQTALLIAGGKKEGEPGFFSPQAFLVRMRIAVLPFVAQVWEGAWLLEAPLSLIKSVVHIVMELVRAENEEAKDGVPGMPTIVPAVVQPDETRITQITDMGFSRGAARRALMRTRNNVATATELLITQPFLFPAGDDDDEGNTPAAPPVAEPIAAVTEPDTTPAPNDSAADASDVEVEEALSVKTSEQWLAELRELRDPLEKNVGRVALRVVDAHPGLIFEVQSLFVGTQGSKQEPSIRQLVDDIKTFSPAAYDVQEQPLAVRCRLLALSLSHPGCQDVVKADAKNLMDSLLALLLSRPADGVTQPKWLAAHLLVADALLMMGEQPRAITLPAEGDAIVLQALNDGSAYPEARTILFDTCMRLIGLPTLAPTDLLSCLRILILLTREHRYALELAKRGGVASLLACIRQGDKDNALAVRTHVMVLLRHVVEDPAALQGIMRLAFKRYFANPKLGTQDIGAFVRGCGAVALRDPAAFVEAAGAVCKLSRPFGPPQLVSLKEAAAAAAPANVAVGVDEKEKEAEGAIQVDGGAPAHEALEPLVHLLIKELLSSSRTVLEEVRAKSTATAKDTGTVAAGGTDASSTTPAEQQQEGSAELAAPSTDMPASKEVDASYACYVMQALAELLFSYDSCKMAFLAYTEKKRGNTPSKDKARPAALQYLLTDLVNVSALDTKANDPVKPPGVLCNWAMSIIVALCVDTAYAQDMKDLSPEVVLVRKTVLDAVARAFREVPVALGVEARYGRLMALSDLVYRLLTVRPHFTTKKPQEDTPTHLAKLMLEKNFVALLTTAFNDVDLNYPHVKNLVTTILKPLELLYVVHWQNIMCI
jgi:E3 ubiquitin-protein ligase HUWE1